MDKLIISLCVVMLALLPSSAADVRAEDNQGKAAAILDDSDWRAGPSEAWFVNWDKALAEARKTGKAMFVLNTGSDWCYWCKKLHNEVLDKPEFMSFAQEHLVLLYLDSPNREPLGNEQKRHNRQIVKALGFGGGVPAVVLVSAAGKRLGSINGGGQSLEDYLRRVEDALKAEAQDIETPDASILFNQGYAALAEKVAARLAALPPVAKDDFKVRVTGLAVADQQGVRERGSIEFNATDTAHDVPCGKMVIVRVEYDLPNGYEARIRTMASFPREERAKARSFRSAPSKLLKGKGVIYGSMSLPDMSETIEVKEIVVMIMPEPETDDSPYGWKASAIPVTLKFAARDGDGIATAAADVPPDVEQRQNGVSTNGTAVGLSDKDRAKAKKIRDGFIRESNNHSSSPKAFFRDSRVVFRELAKFVPDQFYLVTEKPYEERLRYYSSQEKETLLEEACAKLAKKGCRLTGRDSDKDLRLLTDRIIGCGRPVSTIDTKRIPMRKAVDMCGMTQVGLWLDMQKVKDQQHRIVIPNGYDHRRIAQHLKFARWIFFVYPDDEVDKYAGSQEKPVNKYCPYSAESFAHLPRSEKNRILRLFKFVPPKLVSRLDYTPTIKERDEWSDEEANVKRIRQHAKSLHKQEDVARVHALCLELVNYRYPLAMFKRDATIDEIVLCSKNKSGMGALMGWISVNSKEEFEWDVERLKALGKHLERPDVVKFAEDMREGKFRFRGGGQAAGIE